MVEPLISVIIPTYNRMDLIAETIQSVINQTYKNIEILVSDDGSTDDTKNIVEQIKDSRIKYIRITHSGIPSVARNSAIKKSKGEYIAFLDSDDLWYPDKLKTQIEEFQKFPDIGIICTNAINFNEKGEIGLKIDKSIVEKDFLFESLIRKNHYICSSVMIKAKILDDVDIFDENPKIVAGEDYHLWLRIVKNYKVKYINKPLVKYRTHTEVIRKGNEKAYKLYKNIFKDLWEKNIIDTATYKSKINNLEREIEYEKFIKLLKGRQKEFGRRLPGLIKDILNNNKITFFEKLKLVIWLESNLISPRLFGYVNSRLFSMINDS